MKNTSIAQKIFSWLIMFICCLVIIPIFYVLAQILFILCCWVVDYLQLF
ncbi:hypothetical protein Si122_00244 [Streptococcus infantarius subsp. infantarius]|nr:hypothetical protein [Streptococcus infantarius subsp. infantarius]